jgi:hypothetical protein
VEGGAEKEEVRPPTHAAIPRLTSIRDCGVSDKAQARDLLPSYDVIPFVSAINAVSRFSSSSRKSVSR